MKTKHFKTKLLLGIYMLLITTIVLSGVVSFAEEETGISLEQYNNAEFNLNINYPSDWEVQENFMGTVAIFLSPQESPTDQFRENLNIVTQDLTQQPMTLDEYFETSIAQIKQLMTDFQQVSSEKVNFLNEEAYSIIYTATQGSFKVKIMQYLYIKDNTAYVVTYSAEEENYNQYISIIEQMLNSFRIRRFHNS